MGLREDETLEFKLADAIASPERILATIVAFLNTRGGDIYIGVGEQNGVAMALPGVADVEKSRGRLIDLMADRIEPRPGVEAPRVVANPGGAPVLVVHVEPSTKGPHVVRIRDGHTAYERIADRNRPLSFEELRRRLRPRGLENESGRMKTLQTERRALVADSSPTTLRLVVAPDDGAGSFDLNGEVEAAMADVTRAGNRRSGWTYEADGQIRRGQGRREGGISDPPFRHLLVERSGKLEFRTVRGDEWTWSIGAGRYPCPPALVDAYIDPRVIIEYPLSVLRLASFLHRRRMPEADFLIDFTLRGIRGGFLPPGRPDQRTWMPPPDPPRFGEDHLFVGATAPLRVEAQRLIEAPDAIAYLIVAEAYEAFGLGPDAIPYWHPRSATFVF
jgi:hypothetical protein